MPIGFASEFFGCAADFFVPLCFPETMALLVQVDTCRAYSPHALQIKCKREGAARKLGLNRALRLRNSNFFQHARQNFVANIFAYEFDAHQALGFHLPVHECPLPHLSYFRWYTRIYEYFASNMKVSIILAVFSPYTLPRYPFIP